MENGFYSWAPGKRLHNCNSVLVFPSWAGSQPCEKVSAVYPAHTEVKEPEMNQIPFPPSGSSESGGDRGEASGCRSCSALFPVFPQSYEFLTVGCPMTLTLTQRATPDLSWMQQLNMVRKYLLYSILFIIKILFNFCHGSVAQLFRCCPVHQKVACLIPS